MLVVESPGNAHKVLITEFGEVRPTARFGRRRRRAAPTPPPSQCAVPRGVVHSLRAHCIALRFVSDLN